jgi:hypothetical protein
LAEAVAAAGVHLTLYKAAQDMPIMILSEIQIALIKTSDLMGLLHKVLLHE